MPDGLSTGSRPTLPDSPVTYLYVVRLQRRVTPAMPDVYVSHLI